jgi:protein SCO1/2
MKLFNISIIALLFLAACSSNTSADKKLPIYGEREPVTNTVNGKSVTDTVYHTIPNFKFVNQYGKDITQESLNNDIYVTDFFFTSCPSICPIMHRNMLNVYQEFKNTPDVKILSHTIDPGHDSVKVLKKYADNLGVSGNSWWFLQGPKETTYKLAESYLVSVAEDKNAAGGYVHAGYFILVDKQKRIRGTYDGTKPEDTQKLIADIKTLQAEYNNNKTT